MLPIQLTKQLSIVRAHYHSNRSSSRELPNLPQDGEKIVGYRKAMTLPKMPKKMVVVGSGAIGVEFAYFYNSMGADVTLVEYLPNIVPLEDQDISKQLGRTFKKAGIKVMTNSSVESVDTVVLDVKFSQN